MTLLHPKNLNIPQSFHIVFKFESVFFFFFFFFPAQFHRHQHKAAPQPTQHTAIKNNQLKPIKTNEAVILEPPLTSSSKRRVVSLSGNSSHSPSPPTSNNLFFFQGNANTFSWQQREREARGGGETCSCGQLRQLRSSSRCCEFVEQRVSAERSSVRRGGVAARLRKDQGISEWTGCGSVSVGLSFLRSL